MPWFWGSSKKKNDDDDDEEGSYDSEDDESYDSEEDDYESEEEEEDSPRLEMEEEEEADLESVDINHESSPTTTRTPTAQTPTTKEMTVDHKNDNDPIAETATKQHYPKKQDDTKEEEEQDNTDQPDESENNCHDNTAAEKRISQNDPAMTNDEEANQQEEMPKSRPDSYLNHETDDNNDFGSKKDNDRPAAEMPNDSEDHDQNNVTAAKNEKRSEDEKLATQEQRQQQQQQKNQRAYNKNHYGVNPQDDDDDDVDSNNNDYDDDENQPGELVLQGAIPEEVVGLRDRVHSTITQDEDVDTDDDDDDEDHGDHLSSADQTLESGDEASEPGDEDDDDDDELNASTTMEEKQSLLILAAEHDRADIINNLLAQCAKEASSTTTTAAAAAEEGQSVNTGEVSHTATAAAATNKEALLHGGLPALHVALLYGSMNAINCLLRAGADPSVRPDTANAAPSLLKSVSNARLLQGVSAWELVFGEGGRDGNGGSGKSKNNKNGRLSLAEDKKASIQHAFAAEALRCIGSDEVERLQQLLDAGVPITLDVGGKSLSEWILEMDAIQCQQRLGLTKPSSPSTNNDNQENEESASNTTTTTSAVLDRPVESLSSLRNRLDELDSLARALSTCLENLDEEVSVCHGLLMMGGGAAALAAHVKSLKAQRERKQQELMRLQEAWENSEDELAYWIREAGGPKAVEEILATATAAATTTAKASSATAAETTVSPAKAVSTIVSTSVKRTHDKIPPKNGTESNNNKNSHHHHSDDGDENNGHENDDGHVATKRRQELEAQIMASETKVRKLRVSITDLSEENARNLTEVERRGLTGGIQLVRNLRDEIRQVEFELDRAKEGDALCRSRIALVQHQVLQQQQQSSPPRHATNTNGKGEEQLTKSVSASVQSQTSEQSELRSNGPELANNQPQRTTESASLTTNDDRRRTAELESRENAETEMDPEEGDSSVPKGTAPLGSIEAIPSPSPSKSMDAPPSLSSSSTRSIGSPAATKKEEATSPKIETLLPDSERIARGQSTALVVSSPHNNGGRGIFPLGLWEILLRIIGIGGNDGVTAVSATSSTATANGNNLNNSGSSHSRDRRPNRSGQRQPAVII